MTPPAEEKAMEADDDMQQCEHCLRSVDISDCSMMEDVWICSKCYAEWKAEFDDCEHDWKPYVTSMGEDGRICERCHGVVTNPESETPPTTDTEIRPIHAAIPDGEVDEIRKRHERDEDRFNFATITELREMGLKAHKDRATLLARLTALEAEWAGERNESAIHSADLAATSQRQLDRIVALEAENAALKAARDKRAPVQGYVAGIPWEMHLRAYDAYCKRHGGQKALIEGGCRGGFSTGELDQFIPGWREELSDRKAMQDEIAALKAEVAEARAKAIEECAKVADAHAQRFADSAGSACDGDWAVTFHYQEAACEDVAAAIRSLSTSQGGASEVPASVQNITPTCRQNRGDAGALDEAFDRIRRAYTDYVTESSNAGVTWRVSLVRVES